MNFALVMKRMLRRASSALAEEDIIGAKRFEGAVRDEKTSSGYSYSYGATSSTGGMSAMAKGALYDAIFQAVDFISDKVD